MKALTVRQPWAWGIIHGPKAIENRSRRTWHRGDLVIHAGLSRSEFRAGRPDILGGYRDFSELFPGLPTAEGLAFGALLGVVRVVDCLPFAEVAGRPFAEGPWCWELAEVRPFAGPIAWPGSLGLFNLPDEVVRRGLARSADF